MLPLPSRRLKTLIESCSSRIESRDILDVSTLVAFHAILNGALSHTRRRYVEVVMCFANNHDVFALRNDSERIAKIDSEVYGALARPPKVINKDAGFLSVTLTKNMVNPYDVAATQNVDFLPYNVSYTFFVPQHCLKSLLIRDGNSILELASVSDRTSDVIVYSV